MARPPLPLDTAGSISATEMRPKVWRARCRYRRPTGRTVQLERTGPSRSAAIRNLQAALRDVQSEATGPIKPQSTFAELARVWTARLDGLVAEGALRATTADLYRGQLRSVIVPALGELRIREISVGRLDLFFADLAARPGRQGRPLSAKYRRSIREVLRQVLALAVKHEALASNPVPLMNPIRGQPASARGLTPEERRRLFAWMEGQSDDPTEAKAQAAARRRDLPDLICFMIGTGVFSAGPSLWRAISPRLRQLRG